MRARRFGHATTSRTSSKNELVGMKSLLESDVYDADGNYVGKLEEIVIDFRSGCARHAIVSVGGVFGLGRKRLAVPWGALTKETDERRCVVDIAQMDLMSVQIPDRDAWPRPGAPRARAVGTGD